MAVNVIKRKLDNNSSVRTTKIDSNNNTTTEEVHANSNNNNNNNNNTGFVLVPNIKQEDGVVDEGYQERCQVASIQFAAERSAAATTSVTTRKATAFGHEYEQTIMPKGVDTVYRLVKTLTGSLGGNLSLIHI